jgi:type 1 glutamine amidotransferase
MILSVSHQILFIHDPKQHHSPQAAQMLGEIVRAAGIDVTATDDVARVSTLPEGEFAGVMIYTQNDTFSPPQVEALTQFVRGGGGLVGVHSATATNKTDDAYARLLGSRFAGHGPVLDFEVTVSDPDHPIARGMRNFRIRDELYMSKAFDQFRTFLTGSWKDTMQPLGYTKSEGNGRVAYLANGHDTVAMSSREFQQLLVRAVRWACGDDRLDAPTSRQHQ